MINRDPKLFVITIPQYGLYGEPAGEIEVDLSDPRYEQQVLSAAARFRALKRKKRAGGRKSKASLLKQADEIQLDIEG